ncbi:MAG: VCBS repeat-containing protein, partial [Polyangiales bacterium]
MGWSYRLSTILLAVMLSPAESAIYVLVRAPEGAAQSYVLNVDHSTDPPVGADLSFTRTTIEDSQAPWGKNLADVDGDGFLDILTGGGWQGGDVFWYAYPDWTKHQIASYGGGDDLQVVDMNADGAVDVIGTGDPIIWFENPRGSGGNPQAQWSGHMSEQPHSH